MKKPPQSSTERKFPLTIKVATIAIIVYYLLGLFLGYPAMKIRCDRSGYKCQTLEQYLSDPWLFSNALVWPLLFMEDQDLYNQYNTIFDHLL